MGIARSLSVPAGQLGLIGRTIVRSPQRWSNRLSEWLPRRPPSSMASAWSNTSPGSSCGSAPSPDPRWSAPRRESTRTRGGWGRRPPMAGTGTSRRSVEGSSERRLPRVLVPLVVDDLHDRHDLQGDRLSDRVGARLVGGAAVSSGGQRASPAMRPTDRLRTSTLVNRPNLSHLRCLVRRCVRSGSGIDLANLPRIETALATCRVALTCATVP